MKEAIKLLLMGLAVLCLTLTGQGQGYAADETGAKAKEETYLNMYHQILDAMKNKMDNAPKTGDVTIDFLYEMIPHHEGGVRMAENVMKYGSNLQVKQLAAAIIREQTAGIAQMRDLLERLQKDKLADASQESAYWKGYVAAFNKMVSGMEGARPTGNVDKDFLSEMIPHHGGAMRMALNVLNYTRNRELQTIAEGIADNQSKQLAEMQQLLKQVE